MTRSLLLRIVISVALVVMSSMASFGQVGAGSLLPDPSASAAEFDETDCLWDVPSGLDERDDITCGTVAVPLFHDDPDGDIIELAVAVVSATGSNPSDVPVILLNGGPGGDSGDLFSLLGEDAQFTVAPIYANRDLILFDQRGTGYSEPGLFCPGDLPAGETETVGDFEPEDFEDITFDEFGELCAEELTGLDVDLAAFNTTENAQDINDIRVALGYDMVDLWGQSYGTRLALEAMRLYPDGVINSVILESVLPPQVNAITAEVIGLSDSLTQIFELCAADSSCDDAYPDLGSLLEDAVATFDEEPYETSVDDPITGDTVDLIVDGEIYLSALYIAVFSGILLPVVPALIAEGSDGGTDLLDLILPIAIAQTGIATGMNLVVICQDEWGFESLRESRAQVEAADVLPVLEESLGYYSAIDERYGACDEFDLDLADDVQTEAVESDIPALVISGQFDPITPPSFAEEAADTLANAFVIVIPNLAHTPVLFGGACTLNLAIDFLDDPEREPNTTCIDDLELEFVAL